MRTLLPFLNRTTNIKNNHNRKHRYHLQLSLCLCSAFLTRNQSNFVSSASFISTSTTKITPLRRHLEQTQTQPSSNHKLPFTRFMSSSSSANENEKEPGKVLVVGSANQDLVAYTPRLPVPGETILGNSFETYCGGKGANQAVAAASLGFAPVSIVCKVGKDAFGEVLLDNFRKFYKRMNSIVSD